MNWLDITILLPLVWFAYKGFTKGLVREVFGIAGMVIAVYSAFTWMDELALRLEPFSSASSDTLTLIAALILFFSILLAAYLLAWLIRNFLEFLRLHILNRLFGLVFGALKCLVVISVLLLIMAGFNRPSSESREDSALYPWVLNAAPVVYNTTARLVPGAEDFVTNLRENLEENNPIYNLPMFNP
ncbi:MAG: CvpA family protein [Balneolaceae bacterium]